MKYIPKNAVSALALNWVQFRFWVDIKFFCEDHQGCIWYGRRQIG